MKHLVILLITGLTLVGCSSSPKQPATPEISIDWSTHFKNMLALEQWQANAKFAISANGNSKSARLAWLQNKEAFDITFLGPLGSSGPRLFGDQNTATLAVPKEEPIKSSNTSTLLQQKFGWQLPVENAKYWIKGIPSPNSQSNITLKDERLLTLIQDGWTINYAKYKKVNNDYRPTQVSITRDELKILLVIYDWHPEQSPAAI